MEKQRIGEKIYLRMMEDKDIEDVVNWRNNKRVQSRFIYQEPFTIEGQKAWIENMIKPGKVVQFIICEKDTDKSVGCVYFRDIDKNHRKAEYGIFIGDDGAVGKGYGTEACKLACDYGFHEMALHRIFLRVFADNAQAMKSYENGGFEKEAYLHDDVCIRGKFYDIVLMGQINPAEREQNQ